MNSGRLLYSAISGTGDWSVVISTFTSPWLWRIVLAAAGVFIYSPAVSFAVAAMRDLIVRRKIAYQDVWRLALVAYLTASGLLTAAAALNPVNDTLVALAVVGTSFGLNFGLLLFHYSYLNEFSPNLRLPGLCLSIGFGWSWD